MNEKDIKVVSPGYLEENKIELQEKDKIEQLSGQGKTVVFVMIDNKLIGAIALADIIREESKEAIKLLKELGIKTMMLTGDNKQVENGLQMSLSLMSTLLKCYRIKKQKK